MAGDDLPHPRDDDSDISWEEYRFRRENQLERYGVDSPEFHVVHIERIADGGHLLDEANLQTFCKDCHQQKTAEENSEESIERRPELGLDEYH